MELFVELLHLQNQPYFTFLWSSGKATNLYIPGYSITNIWYKTSVHPKSSFPFLDAHVTMNSELFGIQISLCTLWVLVFVFKKKFDYSIAEMLEGTLARNSVAANIISIKLLSQPLLGLIVPYLKKIQCPSYHSIFLNNINVPDHPHCWPSIATIAFVQTLECFYDIVGTRVMCVCVCVNQWLTWIL